MQQHTDQQKDKIREMEAQIALLVAQNKSRRKRKGTPQESAQASTAEPSDGVAADDGLSALKDLIRDSAREFAHIHRAWPLPPGASGPNQSFAPSGIHGTTRGRQMPSPMTRSA